MVILTTAFFHAKISNEPFFTKESALLESTFGFLIRHGVAQCVAEHAFKNYNRVNEVCESSPFLALMAENNGSPYFV